MEKTIIKNKHGHQHLRRLRGKYKRIAAAVAGAAIMAGVALPGIPTAKVMAAEKSSPETSVSVKQPAEHDKDLKKLPEKKPVKKPEKKAEKPPGPGWHEHKHSWPGSDENQAWVDEQGRIFYRSNSDKVPSIYDFDQFLSSPIAFVLQHADAYGFDANLDKFRLLYRSSKRALVEVTQHDTGRLFNILLEKANDSWEIVQTRAL